MSSQPIYIVTEETTAEDLAAEPLLVNGLARLVALSDGTELPENDYTINGLASIGILVNDHDPSDDPLAISGTADLLFRTDDDSDPTGNELAERGIAQLVEILNSEVLGDAPVIPDDALLAENDAPWTFRSAADYIQMS